MVSIYQKGTLRNSFLVIIETYDVSQLVFVSDRSFMYTVHIYIYIISSKVFGSLLGNLMEIQFLAIYVLKRNLVNF